MSEAWLITESLIDDSEGITGPSTITESDIKKLKRGEGYEWEAYDDDGNLYFKGLALSKTTSPLADFAKPWAGAVRIKYPEDEEDYKVAPRRPLQVD